MNDSAALPHVRTWRGEGRVLLVTEGIRFIAQRDASTGAFRLASPSGRFLGEYSSIAECIERVRDAARARGDVD